MTEGQICGWVCLGVFSSLTWLPCVVGYIVNQLMGTSANTCYETGLEIIGWILVVGGVLGTLVLGVLGVLGMMG